MIKNLKIIQWNCRGVRSKINELKYFLSLSNPDVLCLNETNLHVEDGFQISIPNYISIEPNRRSNGRGVVILVKKELNCSPIFIDNNFRRTPIEVVGVRVIISNIDYSIFTFYISLSYSVTQAHLNRVMAQISNIAHQLLSMATLILTTFFGVLKILISVENFS